MAGDRLDDLAGVLGEAEAVAERAMRARDGSSAVRGSDRAGAVTVTVDGDGRVAGVAVAAGWRRAVGVDGMPGAVREAVQAAAGARLAVWGEAFTGPVRPSPEASSVSAVVRDDFAERLREAATGRMSSGDGRAALVELLALAQAIEQGIDDVSVRLQSTLDATHTGRSPDGRVQVTVTGSGDVTDVRYDRAFLLEAHEINIGRLTSAAFTAAYRQAAERGVGRLIADSALGEVQRVTRDPVELARRLRMRH